MTEQEAIISMYEKVASGDAKKASVSLAAPGQPYTEITVYQVGSVIRIDVKRDAA